MEGHQHDLDRRCACFYSPGMTKRERVEAVIAGRRPDHPPVSFWHHFPPEQAAGQAAVDAHLRFLDTYDQDFLKVMNDHQYPRGDVDVLRSVEDLRRIRALPGDAAGFDGQLDVLRRLRERLGPDVPACTTIFNAWALLRYFTQPPSDRHGPPRLDGATDDRDATLSRLLREDRSAIRAAVEALSISLAGFARACVEAGADGVFLSVRDDWVNRPENGPDTYDEIVRPADLRILEAVRDARFNVLHLCGRPQGFDRFAAYPHVQVLNWADRAAGPSIAEAIRLQARSASEKHPPALAAGVDNLDTLPNGTPVDCAGEVRDALRQAGDRPIMIAAGCTFDPQAVPPANLKAVVAAARE
ncbi:MAG: hypothetical protein AMXMBFR13_49940 [Phycisphaerae bacterium]